MKRLVSVILLLFFVFGLVSDAAAETLRGTKVYDLRAEVEQVGHGEGAAYTIRLTWKVDVKENVGPGLGDTKVSIRKSNSNFYLSTADIVKTIPLTEGGNGVVMSWSDYATEPGEIWYRVETGSISSRFAEIKVAVQPKDASPEPDDRREEHAKSVSWPERLAASLIVAIPNWLVNVLGLCDPLELVFMVDTDAPKQGNLPPQIELPYWHVYTEDEMQAVTTFYDSLQEFVPIWLVVAVVLMALGVLYNAANPQSKVGFREYILGFALSMILLKFGAQLLTFIFEVNYALVQQFLDIALPYFQNGSAFLEMIILADDQLTLGDALIAFIAALCIGVLNFQYILRKINIALLVGLIPIVAVIAITPAKRYTLGIWFRELIANIFLQAAHAAVLAFLLLIIAASGDGMQGFWVKLVALMGLAGMAGLVRSVIGAETVGNSPMGSAGAMFGVAGLFAMGKMLGGGRKTAGTATAAAGSLGTAGRIGAGVGRVGLAATGAMAGGMIAGAAIENPAMGVAMGGALGSALGARGADMFGGQPGTIGRDDAARQASREVFGRDVLTGGPVYSSRYAPKAQAYVEGARQSLAQAKTSLENYKPIYDETRARHAELKNLYGPKAAHLQNLKEEQLPQAESRLNNAEQRYLEVLNIPEESRGADYQETLRAAELDYRHAQASVASIETEIESGVQAYRESIEAQQAAEVEYARRQQAVAQAEQRLTQENLVREFTKIKEQQTKHAHGGINSPQW